MTPARRRGSRSRASRIGPGPIAGRRHGAADATREPEPGPAPEAVFDRVTGPLGPYLRRVARIAPARPGARADEGA
ncbi:MAG TPA: hypothetical protein VHT91_20855 [Kofleriaceae bacterium]|jgi:hypothetical protein|nr:hypothetical protein [Kofleriaceae bacterium]